MKKLLLSIATVMLFTTLTACSSDNQERDTDRDGIPDRVEQQHSNASTGKHDSSNDTITGYPDTDQDGIPDYLDRDSDNDGISDRDETAADDNNNGIPNYRDPN